MGKFFVYFGIWLVTARRHIKIMHVKTIDTHMNMAGIPLAKKFAFFNKLKGAFGHHRNTVIALLAINRDMLIAGLAEIAMRKF